MTAFEVVLTAKHLALVMELAAGGPLTDYVTKRYTSLQKRGGLYLAESEARYFFYQVRGMAWFGPRRLGVLWKVLAEAQELGHGRQALDRSYYYCYILLSQGPY